MRKKVKVPMSVYGSHGESADEVSPIPGVSYAPAQLPQRVRFEIIGESWDLLIKRWGTWLVAGLLFTVPAFLLFVVVYGVMIVQIWPLITTRHNGPDAAQFALIQLQFYGVSIPLGIVLSAFEGIIEGGMVRMAFRQMRGETISVGDLFKVGDVIWPLMAVGILQNVALQIGLTLFYIPGIIVGGLLMLAIPLVTERRMPTIAALRESVNVLKHDLINASLFFFVISVVFSLGMLLCGIGIAFTFPLMPIVMAFLYRDFNLGGPSRPGYPTESPSGPSNPWASH
jgi:hypothetical protein